MRPYPRTPGLRWLLLATALSLVPLALLPVVTVDGPAHVAGAWVLAHPHLLAIRRAYRSTWFPVPNLLTDLLLTAAVRPLGLAGAQTALAAGWFLALPMALGYALRGVRRGAGWLAVLGLPLAPGYLYAYGFDNFLYGVAAALLVVGFALRHCQDWSARAGAGLALLLLLAYAAHLLPFLMALLVVGVLALVHTRARRRPRLLVVPALSALPSLALTVAFVLRSPPGSALRHDGLAPLLEGLLTLSRPLLVYAQAERVPAAALAVLLAVLAVRARSAPLAPGASAASGTGLAAATALSAVLYLASPSQTSKDFGFLNDRLSLFPPLLLVLWLAGRQLPRRAELLVPPLVLLLAASLVLVRLPTELHYDRDVREYLSVANAVPRGSVVLPLRLAVDAPVDGPVRNPARDPLRHLGSRLAAARESVDLTQYQTRFGYFLFAFRPGYGVGSAGDEVEAVPPPGDVLAAVRPAPDVVLLVGRDRATQAVLADPRTRALLDALRRGYRLAAVSHPTGLVQVWLRRA